VILQKKLEYLLEISYNNRENIQDTYLLRKTKKKKVQRHWKSKRIVQKKNPTFKKAILINQMKLFESRHASKPNLKHLRKQWDMIFQVIFPIPSTRRRFTRLSKIKWLA